MKKSGLIFVLAIIGLVLGHSTVHAYSVNPVPSTVTVGDSFYITWSGFVAPVNVRVYKGTTATDMYITTTGGNSGNILVDTDGWETRTDYKIRVEERANLMQFINSNTFAVTGQKPNILGCLINNGSGSTQSSAVTMQITLSYGPETPTHYMISENDYFTGAIWQTYNSNIINYTFSGSPGMRFLYIKVKNQWGDSWDSGNPDFDNIEYAPILYYNISGYVRDQYNQGITDVVLSGFPNNSTGITNSAGYYEFNNIISTWSGTVTPSKSGYTFTPTSKSYPSLSSSMTNQSYLGTLNVTYSWETEEWGTCSDSCGGGQKTRTVVCKRNDGQVMNDSYCTTVKPDTVSYECPLGDSRLNNNLGTEQYISPQ